MADDNKDGGAAVADNSEEVSSYDLDAQIKALQERKAAAEARAAEKRNAMGDEDFTNSRPKGEGRFDGEVREPGWRWDRSTNQWIEHRGVDYTKLTRASLVAMGHEKLGDGSPQSPHRVQVVNRWI